MCAFLTFCELVEKPFLVDIKCVYNATIVAQVVIWLDVCVQLMIGKANRKQIETKLKEVEVQG